MSKPAYLLLVAALLALGAYAFWPEHGQEPNRVALWGGKAPDAWRIVAEGADESVAGARVRVAGCDLPLDRDRALRLWFALGERALDPAAAVAGVDGAALASYGLDGAREIAVGDVRLRYGEAGGRAFAWRSDEKRAWPLDAPFAKRLAQAWARVDAPPIAARAATALTVDGLALARAGDGSWGAPAAPQRPAFTNRVESLIGLVADLRIASLAPIAVGGDARGRVEIDGHTLLVLGSDDACHLVVDALPAQPLAPAQAKRWTSLIASFREDYLFSLPARGLGDPIEEIVVRHDGGADWFRLERRGNEDRVDGRSQWDLLWPGGRVTASADIAERMQEAFELVVVGDPSVRVDPASYAPAARVAAPPPLGPDAVSVDLIGQLIRDPIRIEYTADRAASPTHVGRIVRLPPLLRDLSPDAVLDREPVSRSTVRMEKLQRIVRDGATTRGETFARDRSGAWARTYPRDGGDADAVAVEALAQACSGLRATSARLARDADRAILDAPELSIACRFAPRPAKRADDAAALEETATLEQSLAFARVDGVWRAVDQDGALAYAFADATVDALRRPLDAKLVWPLAPTLVGRVIVARGDQRYALVRVSEDAWVVQDDDGATVAADPIAVARYLRALSELTAERVDPRAAPLAADEGVGVVTCVVPGFGGEDLHLGLHVGRPGADGLTPLSTDSTRQAAPGRRWARLDADAALPPRTRFVAR